jgi:hypothetical protein
MPDPFIGLFLPTTPLFDVGDLEDPAQSRELIIRLTQKINDIIIALNLKDTGYYPLDVFVNGQSFFENPALSDVSTQLPTFRQVFRKVFLSGPLPNVGTLTIPHGIPITASFTFTRIYGAASDTNGFNYIPLPEAFVNGNIVDLSVNLMDIVIHTNWNASNFLVVYIVLEWLEN